MFSNIGKRIKKYAKYYAVCGFLFAAVGLVVAIGCGFDDVGLICLISGVVVGCCTFVSSWFVYGFGQLIDDVHEIRNKDKNRNETHFEELPDL